MPFVVARLVDFTCDCGLLWRRTILETARWRIAMARSMKLRLRYVNRYCNVRHPADASKWTMMVSVEDFIPSLTGFTRSLDITTALRLCNRYGRGASCYVSKLPTELIDLIEIHVHIATRQTAFAEWEQQRMCTETRCTCDYDERWPVERRELHKSRLVEDGLTPHHANIRAFCLRTRGFRALGADAQLVKKYFGLDIWTPITHSYDVHPGEIRLRPLSSPHQVQSQLFFMLPGFLQHKCSGIDQGFENSSIAYDFKAAPGPDRRVMRRFLRVFRMLGLLNNGDLRMLEAVVNLAAPGSTNESNFGLRERILSKLAEFGRGAQQYVAEGKAWPDIVHVQRRSSWESRMQTGWLAHDAL